MIKPILIAFLIVIFTIVSPLNVYSFDKIKNETLELTKQELISEFEDLSHLKSNLNMNHDQLSSRILIHPNVSSALLFVGAFLQLMPAIPLFSNQMYPEGVNKFLESLQYSSLIFSSIMFISWIYHLIVTSSDLEAIPNFNQIMYYLAALSTVIVPFIILTPVLLEQNQELFSIKMFSLRF